MASIELTLVLIAWKFNLTVNMFFSVCFVYPEIHLNTFLQHSRKTMVRYIGFGWSDILDYIYAIDLDTRPCQTEFRT